MNTQQVIESRHTVRFFTSEGITAEQRDRLVSAMQASPLAGGVGKLMRITVVENPELRNQVSSATAEAANFPTGKDPLYGAQTVIIISGKADFDPTALYANFGCIAENAQLSAHAQGLGSCIIWSIRGALEHNAELKAALGIPADFLPLAGVVAGPAAKEPAQRNRSHQMEVHYC